MVIKEELQEYNEELYIVSKSIFEEHNKPYTKPYEKKDYRLALKFDGKIIGGLTGYSGFDWFYIETLAVDKKHRNKGLATDLLKTAEDEARSRNCFGIWLNTISFQAPDFYKDLGYIEFDRHKNCPEGYERVFLKKYLKEDN